MLRTVDIEIRRMDDSYPHTYYVRTWGATNMDYTAGYACGGLWDAVFLGIREQMALVRKEG
jgi:hypothetical protein